MSHKLKYFKKFLDDPASFPNRAFYKKIKKWAEYVTAHKNEFDYLKDDEWKEIRERVLTELERRQDLKEEFEEIDFQYSLFEQLQPADRRKLHRRWLEFMRRNKFDFEFTDEQIAELEEGLKDCERADEKCRIADENLRIAREERIKAVEKLSDHMFEYYERTGKRPILTALRRSKSLIGN